ncbi:FUSC family protein [Pseudomonas sp. 10B1]|uniref:FUSC family protein n=1 Tax=unclassified Pseudomonas TaxID=196821 RepID=UPI002B2326B2|nr:MULTISPECIES: FUSC family protein [unclassified Pseudomonas]MEA9995673.1 FUSC family protein [Pseudomonas sp. AA4]MEB0088000.1 FUSC family protein [Pseudomonas sp. RTI1]MEB0126994.1 FUSC family protein [Pseudomonas sp. CCC1.2]MEB0154436.1 FUSC family protein [Pseudomonas sp. CCC4.3]MEB0219065.1 FUSC family protein [Pseudomonas sp. AB12(2023)]
MKGFFASVPPARDWFFGLRTFAASMVALYIALIMELPRPYWAMATVYIVSSPFVGPTSSKALYRAIGTFAGAAAAVLFVPLFVQTPILLAIVIALWTGTLLFLSLHLRTANSYALMLAGYTLPLIAFPVVNNPMAVFDIAVARTEEIFLGIVCAAVIGAMFWPRHLAPVVMDTTNKWFADASAYSDRFLSRTHQSEEIGSLRAAMVGSFNSLELMIGQLSHEGVHSQSVRNSKELRGRMIHLLPVIDALDDALWAIERRTPDLLAHLKLALEDARAWLTNTHENASPEKWKALRATLEQLQPSPERLDDRHQLLLSNALYRLNEWVDLWQDCRSLQHALRTDDQSPWRAVYRHWRLGRLTPFLDRGLMLYSVLSGVAAIIVASVLWILLGWPEGGSAVILAAVACSFFAAMDDPAPQIYRFFFWTTVAVILASLYLFLVLPNINDFPMLVLAFAVPFIWIATLTVQPRFYLGTLLTLVNTATFISIQGTYDTDFLVFINNNLAGPIGLLFAFVWTLVVRPFGVEFAAKRLTRFGWHDIASLSQPGTLNEHRLMAVKMLDRLMQHLPRLTITAQDTGIALRELRVTLNLLDLLAYLPRVHPAPQALLRQVINDVSAYFQACLDARERLPAPKGLLNTMDRARRSMTFDGMGDDPTRIHLLHALSGLRLALLPGVEIVKAGEFAELPPYGLDGAPL